MADRLHGDTVAKRGTPPPYVRPCLRAVHTVLTSGGIVPPNPKQQPPKRTVTGEDLCQPVGEDDAVVSLQPFLKEGPYRRDCGMPLLDSTCTHNNDPLNHNQEKCMVFWCSF